MVRSILSLDREWAVYALGDLSPSRFPSSEWHVGPGAVVLLYRGFSTPVLFALGDAGKVDDRLNELPTERKMFLHIRPEIVPMVRQRYRVTDETPMWRMILDQELLPALTDGRVEPLTAADLPLLQRLYADGETAGESPSFFEPSMLTDGAYFAIRQGGELISAAGTHLVEPEEGIAAIGNVYTRRDSRNRGLGRSVTQAVAQELVRRRILTIALNVHQLNAPAVHVYEELGFRKHCEFREGVAVSP